MKNDDVSDKTPEPGRKEKLKKKLRKLFFWLLAILALYLLFLYFKQDILDLIKSNYYTWVVYSHITMQISEKTLLGLAYAGFFGSLFFILIPLEAIFFYYLALPHHAILVVVIMLVSSLFGLAVDYLIGRLVGEGLLMRFAEAKFLKYKRAMEKFGPGIILVSNIIPFLPVQIISLIIGATRFGLKRFFIYTLIGRGAYLIGLYFTADFFKTHLLPFLS